MAKEYALVNAEYEFELYKDELGVTTPERVLRNRKMTEFMFFFMNKNDSTGLLAHHHYPSDYLDYLKSLGLIIPSIKHEGESFNWYGQLKNIPKEKRLNSKLWGYELLNQLKMNPSENFVVCSKNEVLNHLSSQPAPMQWMLKCPYLMSGLNFYQITSTHDVPDISTPHLLEPYFDRLLDLALYYCPLTQEKFFYVSRTTSSGRYKGGVIFEKTTGLTEHVASIGLSDSFRDLQKDSLLILDVLISEGLEQPLTVDSFILSTKKGNSYHPGCDINYRQNMGGLLLSLKSFLPKEGVGEFMLIQKIPTLKHNQFMSYSKKNKTGVIYLSPPDSDSLGIFFSSRNLGELARMKTLFFHSVHHN